MHRIKNLKDALHKANMWIKSNYKSLRNERFYSVVVISILTSALIISSSSFSILTDKETVKNSGIIGTIPPLHVEGRYIKNSFNQVVLLRGVNKAEMVDDPDGIWMGDTLWKDENVKAELDVMKSWGINVIRVFISVELVKYDIGPDSGHPASPHCSISAREAIKRLLSFAEEKGMYVIIAPWSIRCYWTGAEPDQLPFPPYQRSPDADTIIGSQQDFADWWGELAGELKDYPNVLFELWNEPNRNDPPTAFNEWLNCSQLCINAIRAAGASQPIIFQWQMGVYCNVYEDDQGQPFAAWGEPINDWLQAATSNLTDPEGNLIYSTHVYRVYGGFGQYITPSVKEKYGSSFPYLYDHIKVALEHEGINWAGETLNVPLIIGECGCDMDWSGDEYQHEMTAWRSFLAILNEWELSYVAFWWRETGIFRLHSGAPNFTPNEGGQILKEMIVSGAT
ncbi:cellulase family glycosylhydrolase [Candidatus Bathyarchaeota archaeon]|nr:cellulase family glycosylhydrolase [Candidatus Bathyarchaeota archaeon]